MPSRNFGTSSNINKDKSQIFCTECGNCYPVIENVPHFCLQKNNIITKNLNRDYTDISHWTKWRRENFDFCKKAIQGTENDSVVLDIGAGSGHFRKLFMRYKKYITIDFYPYQGITIIADFTKKIPLKSGTANIVLLSNVLEHTPEPAFLLNECNRLLAPKENRLIILVPFIIKIHQAPYDFYRYTSFALERLLKKAGF